jgi:hypothetical protein
VIHSGSLSILHQNRHPLWHFKVYLLESMESFCFQNQSKNEGIANLQLCVQSIEFSLPFIFPFTAFVHYLPTYSWRVSVIMNHYSRPVSLCQFLQFWLISNTISQNQHLLQESQPTPLLISEKKQEMKSLACSGHVVLSFMYLQP